MNDPRNLLSSGVFLKQSQKDTKRDKLNIWTDREQFGPS